VRHLLPHFWSPTGQSVTSVNHHFGWHWADVGPDTVRQVLAEVDERIGTGRPNEQPPAAWLVEQAERFGGVLSGYVTPVQRWLRVDAICVPVQYARDLALLTDDNWPMASPNMTHRSALDLAVAEAWESWRSTVSIWEDNGRALLHFLPPGEVCGLWWD
jgi:hypothetical protein